MARSPFTLAAAVTAAVPGAEVVGARALTSSGDGRFDSAVATLADGRELVIRVAGDDETASELSAESLALRALTAGAREMLPFEVPEALGAAVLGLRGGEPSGQSEPRALVTTLVPGFLVEAADIPAGRGVATAAGAAIAAIHALPASVVRAAGLPERSPAQVREEIRALVDRAATTGRVSARLTVRWREAVASDDLWRFESTVTLGGAQASSFLYVDDPQRGPEVSGLIGWYGLCIGDPAVDLAWLASAPDAADDVHAAYSAAALRSPDTALPTRSRLLAELEFARWLLHGADTRQSDVVDDAAQLLDALADSLDDDLVSRRPRSTGVDEAMTALQSVPAAATGEIDTSMQTDAYDPRSFAGLGVGDAGDAESEDTAVFGPRSTVDDGAESESALGDAEAWEDPDATGPIDLPRPGSDGAPDEPSTTAPAGGEHDHAADAEEAQRAARAAFQRWSSSSSE